MPFTNLNLITITGKFVLLNGTPAAGTVTFAADQTLIDSVANEIIVPVAITAVIGPLGTISVQLPATNDPDLAPTGWTYTVTEAILGARVSRTYLIQVPFDAPGATLDLADIVPVAAVTAVSPYALVATIIPKAIFDAKGDLISATAADTPARLGVGTDGQVLTASSAAATGLVWSAAAAGGGPGSDTTAIHTTGDETKAGTFTQTGAHRVTSGEPRYDVKGFGPSSTAAERRTTLQDAINTWAATGGELNLHGAWDISGGSVTLPPLPLGTHTRFRMKGNRNAVLSTTSAHPLIDDTMPVDLTALVNRANRMFDFEDITLKGTNDAAQTLLRVIGSYGSTFRKLTLEAGNDGIDVIFGLQALVENCKAVNNSGRSLRLRSATGIVTGASGSSSGTNCAHVVDWRDYCGAGQLASIALFEADGAVLDNIITEGGNPVRNIDFDANNNTTVKSFWVRVWHDENTPTDCALRIANMGGGVAKVTGIYAQTAHTLIDGRNGGTSATIHVEDVPWLPVGCVPWRGDAFLTFWLFTGHQAGHNPLHSSQWVGGIVPNYAGGAMRPAGVNDPSLGGVYPVMGGSLLSIHTGSGMHLTTESANALNRLGQSTLKVPNADAGLPFNPVTLYDSQAALYQSETADTLGIMVSQADSVRRDAIIPLGVTPVQIADQAKVVKRTTVLTSDEFGLVGDGVADDTVGLQNFFAAWATQKGFAVLRPGNYKATAALNFNHPTSATKANYVLWAYGATITSTFNGVILGDSFPADSTAAAALLQRRITIIGLSITGNGGLAQTGIRLVCRAWPKLDAMTVQGCHTNYDLIFCLQGRVSGCNSHLANFYGYRARSGAGFWTGASGPNSASNHTTFTDGTRDYAYSSVAFAVSNRALTANVVTLTTSNPHGFQAGQRVTVTGIDATFNGAFTIIAVPTTTTLTYAKTAADVASVASGGFATARMLKQFYIEDSQGVVLRDCVTEGGNPAVAVHYTTIVHDTIFGHSGGRTFGINNHHGENFPEDAHIKIDAFSGHVIIDQFDSQTGGVLIDGSASSITTVIYARLPTILSSPAFKTAVGGPRWEFDMPSTSGNNNTRAAASWVDGLVGTQGATRFANPTDEAAISNIGYGIAAEQPFMHGNDIFLLSDRTVFNVPGIHLAGATEIGVHDNGPVGGAFLANSRICAALDITNGLLLTTAKYSNGVVRFASSPLVVQNLLGHLFTRKTTAPADADLAANEMTAFWRSTVGATGLGIKGKDSAGTVVERTLATTIDFETHLDIAHNRLRDSFTRANSATSMGTAETRSKAWTQTIVGGGDWGISSNQAYKPSAGYGVTELDLDAHGVLEVTIAAGATGTEEFWLIARLGAQYIRLGKRSANAAYTLEDQAGTAFGTIATFPNAANGDRLRIVTRRNDGLAAYINNVQYVDTGTATGLNNLRHGLGAVGAGAVRFDDFSFYEL